MKTTFLASLAIITLFYVNISQAKTFTLVDSDTNETYTCSNTGEPAPVRLKKGIYEAFNESMFCLGKVEVLLSSSNGLKLKLGNSQISFICHNGECGDNSNPQNKIKIDAVDGFTITWNRGDTCIYAAE